MQELIVKFRKGFKSGRNTLISEQKNPNQMGLAVYALRSNQRVSVPTENREVALVAFHGKGKFAADDCRVKFSRSDWVKQGPTIIHAARNSGLQIIAHTNCEIIAASILNPHFFETRIYRPCAIKDEWRGKGTLNETATRIVRTAFDRRNSPVLSRMVLGEVVTWPGRWSSYPPHRHEQPEIYYYRFKLPQGYGHAELGGEVFKVRDRNALKITPRRDHAQVSAPGYFMYYLWMIKHLPGKPYRGFVYLPEHAWTAHAKTKA